MMEGLLLIGSGPCVQLDSYECVVYGGGIKWETCRKWLGKSPAALYAAFAGIAVSLGSFGRLSGCANHILVDARGYCFPIGSGLILHVRLLGVWPSLRLRLFSTGKITQWVVDRLGDGPNRRRFEAMSPRLGICNGASHVFLRRRQSFMSGTGRGDSQSMPR